MRSSNRVKILEAAFRVADREGVAGVTFESVAAEAGLSRGGLTYHFPSRESLIEAIHQHLAERWEERMLNIIGKPFSEATAQERFSAYVQTSAQQGASRGELLFMLDASTNGELVTPWIDVPDKWAPPSPRDDDEQAALARFVARLAADGLWVYDSISCKPLTKKLRLKVVEEIGRLFRSGA